MKARFVRFVFAAVALGDAVLVRRHLRQEAAATVTLAAARRARRSPTRSCVQTKDLPAGLDMRVSQRQAGRARLDRSEARAGEEAARRRGRGAARRARSRSRRRPRTSRRSRCAPKSTPPPRTGTGDQGQLSAARPVDAAAAGQGDRHRQDLRRCCARCPRARCRSRPSCRVTFSQPMVAVTSQERRRGDDAGEADADAEGPLAVDRHADDPVRPRGAVPAGDDVPGRDARGHEERDRRRAQGRRRSSRSRRRPPTLVSAATRAADTPQHLDVPMFAMFDQKIDPRRGARGRSRSPRTARRCRSSCSTTRRSPRTRR